MSAQQIITEHLDLWTSAVTHKSSAGRGSNGKLELTGIKKLRELILELAVRGKLVPQDPNDEPASELLKRIEAEKSRLVKEGKIKKPKKLPEVYEDEKPCELPNGWEWVRLGNITQISPRNDVPGSTETSFIPMPLISTSHRGEHEQEVRPWSEIKKGYTHFADGDIALAKITPCFENSKAAVFRNLKNGIGAGTTELHVARPYNESINQLYILLCLKAPTFLTKGESQMTGSAGQKRLPKSFFEGEPLALPPLPEQHRIVEKVDELMALCDHLEQQTSDQISAHETLLDALLDTLVQASAAAELADNWARLVAHFDNLFTTEHSIERLKQTILQLAVMGRLVPQDPNDEPPIKVIRQLESLGGNASIRRGVPENIDKPSWVDNKCLPEPWEILSTARLLKCGAILDIKDGNHGANHPKVSEFTDNGLPFITAKQVSEDGSIDYTGAYKVAGSILDRLRVGFAKKGDVIYTHKGSVGRVAICNQECILTPQTTYYRLNPKIISNLYLRFFMRSSAFRLQVDKVKMQTTRDFVSISAQYKFFIHIPPIEEQHRIVAKVDELMILCDQLKTRLNQANETRCHLAEAVVEQAVG